MRPGTLGDSESENETFDNTTPRPLINPYEQPNVHRDSAQLNRTKYTARKSTSRGQNVSENRPRGAARRKMSYRQRQLKLLRGIAKLQSSTRAMIPKAAFGRLVREITMSLNSEVTHYTRTALEALQEATEMYITQFLSDSYLLTLHRQRVTLSVNDMELLRALKISSTM